MARATTGTSKLTHMRALQPGVPRFVELIRVSTKSQADRDTRELQRRALDRLRERRRGILVERIEALGQSGASPFEERPDLQRLLELARELRAYDEVRVYDLDRLTRSDDLRERAAVYGMIADAGAVIVDASGHVFDPKDESGQSEMDYWLRTYFASQERKRILRRTIDGRRRIAAQGKFAGGAPPYGLKWDKKAGTWIELDDQIAVVCDIFVWSSEGSSTYQIADRLNAMGVPSSKGTRWHPPVVRRLLRSRAYVGEFEVTAGGETFTLSTPKRGRRAV